MHPSRERGGKEAQGEEKMKLLITGGAGFIGSNFIRYTLREHPEWQVVNLDKLTYAGNLASLKDVEDNPRYRFVRGDIADRGLVERLFHEEKFDAVVNFAAESHVDRSILDSSPFIETNVKGVQVLLEAAREFKIKKFVQISTDEVYGSLGPDDPPCTEESPLLPNSPYSASKAAADLLCRAYHKTYGLPVVITRSSNNYGPYQFPEKLIPLMIINALEDKPLPVYGDGQNVRDWLFVEDNCRAIALVIEKGKPGEIYNIGGGEEKRNIDVVNAILRLLGKPESLITFVKDRPGHDRRYALDTGKMFQEFSWQPVVSFEEGLAQTVKWYLENRAWWERVRTGAYGKFIEQWYSFA
ncbi:MAG: dTDP-glucose 4,6-dehydratase [Candidatus Methanosuratincola subterraneus]|uniref:dTDP-glucose 4,6-dehydratase n=1 Tax=Methanosuratincola subterraneus TaxID=2593994 RepID=A0A444L523_METS7|nr:MAG: dTDP-glucose 4,6-dehydratase [Candidatus Methanosuratincola subterraneus]